MSKKIIGLSIASGVLLLTWVIGIFFSPEARNARAQSVNLSIAVQEEKVARIEIDNIVLQHTGSNWFRKTEDEELLPARKDRIEALFENLEELSQARKVSDSSENKEGFGLDADSVLKRSLSMFDEENNLLLGLTFGLPVAGTKTVYATVVDRPEVFSMSDALAFYTRQDKFYWTDLRLFVDRPELNSVNRISFEGTENFTLLLIPNEDSDASDTPFVWVFEDDNSLAVDQERANAVVRTIINLEGSDVLPEGQYTQLLGTISAYTDNSTYSVRIFQDPGEENQFLANPNLGSSGYYYILSETVRDRVLRSKEFFATEDEDDDE